MRLQTEIIKLRDKLQNRVDLLKNREDANMIKRTIDLMTVEISALNWVLDE